jgi:ABC-type phosphate transport system substrate-binding protein
MQVAGAAEEVLMRRPWRAALLTIVLMVLAAAVRADEFQILVHKSVAGTKISRALLASIFMKETVNWGDGSRILPIHQSSKSPVRRAFAQRVLEQTLGEQQLFWRRRMTKTRVLPPPSKASDEEVLAFVATKKGAIGYVGVGVEIPPDVKVLTLFD